MNLRPIKYEVFVAEHSGNKRLEAKTIHQDDIYWVYPISRILILNKNSEIIFDSINDFEEDITGFDFETEIAVSDIIQYSEKPYLVLERPDLPTTYILCIPEEMAKLSEPEYALTGYEYFNDMPCYVEEIVYCGLLNCHFKVTVKSLITNFLSINSRLSELGHDIGNMLHNFIYLEDYLEEMIVSFDEKSSEVMKLLLESKRELQKIRNYTLEDFFKEQGEEKQKNTENKASEDI